MKEFDTIERAARVLVVEDDREERLVLAEVLRARGFEVELAVDGEQAMRQACEDPPDVVLLDAVLPKQSGYLVAAKLKLLGDAPKILMITGLENTGAAQLGVGGRGQTPGQLAAFLGVDGILYKPFSGRQLVQMIERLIGRRPRQMAAVGSV